MNMNKIIIISIVSLIVAGGIFFAVLLRLTPSAAQPTNTDNGSSQGSITGGTTNVTANQPTTGTGTGGVTATPDKTITVPAEHGGTITIRDFKSDPSVITNPNIPGQYILAGGSDPSGTGASYSTFYVDLDQSFNITILQEPIGDVRKQAEQDLMSRLGINQDQACALRYWVGVPNFVNSIYSGKNLGFSFCPGAVAL
jgi:hypothetical protein